MTKNESWWQRNVVGNSEEGDFTSKVEDGNTPSKITQLDDVADVLQGDIEVPDQISLDAAPLEISQELVGGLVQSTFTGAIIEVLRKLIRSGEKNQDTR